MRITIDIDEQLVAHLGQEEVERKSKKPMSGRGKKMDIATRQNESTMKK